MLVLLRENGTWQQCRLAQTEERKDGPHDDLAKYLEKGYAYQVADWHMNGLETSVQLATDAAASLQKCRCAFGSEELSLPCGDKRSGGDGLINDGEKG